MYFIDHSDIFFFYFTFPVLGWLFNGYLSDKNIKRVFLTALMLLLPSITGYLYIIEDLYIVLVYVLLACLFALALAYLNRKLLTTICFSLLLFFPLLLLAFVSGMAGTKTIQQQWEIPGYKVEYMRDQGFSGGALMTYRLKKYALVPLFIKEVDVKVDNDTTNNCIIKFKYENVSFDKCK